MATSVPVMTWSTHFKGKSKTIEKKKELIQACPAGRKGTLHSFKDMKINDLKRELQARGRSGEGKKGRSTERIIQHAWRNNKITSTSP